MALLLDSESFLECQLVSGLRQLIIAWTPPKKTKAEHALWCARVNVAGDDLRRCYGQTTGCPNSIGVLVSTTQWNRAMGGCLFFGSDGHQSY